MALPSIDNNIVGSRVKPVTDLGLSLQVGSGSTITGTAFTTGVPGSVVILANAATGTGTINVALGSSAAAAVTNLASPTATLTLTATGTNYWVEVDTTDSAFADALDPRNNGVPAEANTNSLWVAINEKNTSGGFLLTTLAVLSLYELRGGEDYFVVRAGSLNAVAGCVGQGALQGVNNTTYVSGYQDGDGHVFFSEV